MWMAINKKYLRPCAVALRRQKLDRKANLTLDRGRVIDTPPGWVFTIDCPYHGKIDFDFNPYRGNDRDELAGHMRDAIWSLRHESSGASLATYRESIRRFWRFLDDLLATNEYVTRLDQIDRKCVERYLGWLELQLVTNNKKNMGLPVSIASKRNSYTSLKAILINRQKRNPSAVNPSLNFPRNPFPNSNLLRQKREPYSGSEHRRILDALNRDMRAIHEGNAESLASLQVLMVHLLALASATGINLQPLLELKRDSLREHPHADRELLVTTKRRGWTTFATSVRKSEVPLKDKRTLHAIPTSIGDHFRSLCEFTAPLMVEANQKDQPFAFLWKVSKLSRKGQVVRLDRLIAKTGIRDFTKRHALLDDRGQPLALSFSRFRPTFATELYRRTGDIRRVSQALNHASVETTARNYTSLPLEAERNHAIVVEGMVSRFARMEIEGKVLLAADGKIPSQGAEELLAGGFNTGIARCRNPFRENESVCKKFFTCFKCPSMLVFEDDLWRLFSFYYRLLSERSKQKPDHWLKIYGPIIRRIDNDISPQFPVAKVEAAKFRAKSDPHPTWKGSHL
jgi:integrase